MSRLKTASSAGDRAQGPRMKLPAGVCHVSELMPQVLARYGLSLDDEPRSKQPAPVTETNDFFDVMFIALESVLAS